VLLMRYTDQEGPHGCCCLVGRFAITRKV
jgi:hypothetical protein